MIKPRCPLLRFDLRPVFALSLLAFRVSPTRWRHRNPMGHVIVFGDPGGLWRDTDEANPVTFEPELEKAKVAISDAAKFLLGDRPLYGRWSAHLLGLCFPSHGWHHPRHVA